MCLQYLFSGLFDQGVSAFQVFSAYYICLLVIISIDFFITLPPTVEKIRFLFSFIPRKFISLPLKFSYPLFRRIQRMIMGNEGMAG